MSGVGYFGQSMESGFDLVDQSENWFCYWSSPPSLWEAQFSRFRSDRPVYVIIHWAHHVDRSLGDRAFQESSSGIDSSKELQYDFGDYRPECDLKLIYDLGKKFSLETVFFVGLGPVPFLANGGVPASLGRTVAKDEQGKNIVVLDSTGTAKLMYSFYGPEVFREFRRFCYQLSNNLTVKGMEQQVLGLESGYLTESETETLQWRSYLEDYSDCYNEAWLRYCKANHPEPFTEPKEWSWRRRSYSLEVAELYTKAASDCLAGNWGGVLRINFVGGGPDDFFERQAPDLNQDERFLRYYLETFRHGVIPSGILHEKSKLLPCSQRAVDRLLNLKYFYSALDQEFYSDEIAGALPLSFFKLYFPKTLISESREDLLLKYGLSGFFNRIGRWCYQTLDGPYEFEESEDETGQAVTIFFARYLKTESDLVPVIKKFMSGAKVLLDLSHAKVAILSRLELFIRENQLKEQKLEFLSPVKMVELGDGRLICFEGLALSSCSLQQKLSFWTRVIDSLNLKNMEIEKDEGIQVHWMTRTATAIELDYQEIRRLYVYNPTSYVREVRVNQHAEFSLLKVIDEDRVKVISKPVQIEVSLRPGGSVGLDFGRIFDS